MHKERKEIFPDQTKFKSKRLDWFIRKTLWVIDGYRHVPTKAELAINPKEERDNAIARLSVYKTDYLDQQDIADELILLLNSMRDIPHELPNEVAENFVSAILPFAREIAQGKYALCHNEGLLNEYDRWYKTLEDQFGQYGFKKFAPQETS